MPLLVIIGEDELAKGEVRHSTAGIPCRLYRRLLRRLVVPTPCCLCQVKLRDLDAANADGSKGREWTVRFDDVVAEVQQVGQRCPGGCGLHMARD